VTSLERDGSRADTQSVDVQAAFVNRLSGIVFLLSDIIYTPLTDPIGISSLYDNYEIPGFNRMLSGKPYDGYSRDSARIVKNSIRDKVLAGNQFYFTDWGRQFSFSIEGGRLSMKGFPYYLPIMKNNGTATPLWDHAYPKDLSEASYLYNVSPVIYRSAFRQVKLIQFFRYVKSNCGSQWTAFLDQMDKNNDIEDIEVPMPTEIRY
jgi:hypothetical protein